MDFKSDQFTLCVAIVFIFQVTEVPSGSTAFPVPLMVSVFLFKYEGKFRTISKLEIDGTVTTANSNSLDETSFAST